MTDIKHYSDCAVHNEPALPAGECNCGGYQEIAMIDIVKYLTDKWHLVGEEECRVAATKILCLSAENDKLRAALIAVYRLMDVDGSDIDCCELQDTLEKYDVVVPYMASEPCGEFCTCEIYGPNFPMKCYRLNDDFRAAADALKETGDE